MKEVEIYEITCPRCGEAWTPDPNRWRNNNSIIRNGRKKLHCPFCNKLVSLPKKDTEVLLSGGSKRARNTNIRYKKRKG